MFTNAERVIWGTHFQALKITTKIIILVPAKFIARSEPWKRRAHEAIIVHGSVLKIFLSLPLTILYIHIFYTSTNY